MEKFKRIYRELILKGKYNEAYGNNAIEKDGYLEGVCIDFSKYLVEKMKEKGYKAHIISTRNDDGSLHAAVVYKENETRKLFIADPVTDIRMFTEQDLDINQRKELAENSQNQKIDIKDYITKFGEISLHNSNLAIAKAEIKSVEDLKLAIAKGLEYNHAGFNEFNLHKITGKYYDEKGYDKSGYDREGYNKKGFNEYGKHKNGTRYNDEGYDIDGYDEKGYNQRQFNKNGIHINGTQYDNEGYDSEGYDSDGYDKRGFDRYKKHKNGTQYNDEGFNIYGYDRDGYDVNGFNKYEKHRNGTLFDEDGYDRRGRDKNGFLRDGTHWKTKSKYSPEGYDVDGYNEDGFKRDGFNDEGYDKEGYDRKGFNKDGYNRDGYDIDGYNKNGFNSEGKTASDVEKEKEDNKNQRLKNYLGLVHKAEKLGKGEITIEEYLKTSKTSIEDLIAFAKKEKMSADIIRGLYKQKKPYQLYSKPFNKKEYLEQTSIIMDDKQFVKPTEEDVEKCLEYLRANDIYVCDKNVRDTIKKYIKGELDITEKTGIVSTKVTGQDIGQATFDVDTEKCDELHDDLTNSLQKKQNKNIGETK